MKALKLLNEQGEITIRGLMRKASLSQNGAYSSLNHLARLNLIEPSSERFTRGAAKKYKATGIGEELLLHLSVFFDSLKFLAQKRNIDCYLENSCRTLEILLKICKQGNISLSELVEKEGMCKTTAYSSLQDLTNLGLLRMRLKKSFRTTRKEYSLTEKGQYLGRIILIVDQKMHSLLDCP